MTSFLSCFTASFRSTKMSDRDQRCFFVSLMAFLSFCSGGCLRKLVPEKRCTCAKNSSFLDGIRRLRKFVPEKRCTCAKNSSLLDGIRRCVRKRFERFKNRKKVAPGEENLKEKPEEIDPAEQYKFIRFIGQGTFGFVYAALDQVYSRLVAIKALHMSDASETISKEIIGMKKCHHPNVVDYIGSHVVGENFWIVMEYVSGVHLGDIMQECHMNEGNVAAVSRECLQALEFMHKQNVAHGDIHSENILVGYDGSVKIVDFGLCTIFEDERSCPKEEVKTVNSAGPEVLFAVQEEVKTVNSAVPDVPSAVPDVPSTVPEVPMSKEKATKMDIQRLGMTVTDMLHTDLPYYELLELWSNDPGSPKICCSLQFLDFTDRCLKEDVASRPSASELLQHPFLKLATPLEDLKPLVLAAKKEENGLPQTIFVGEADETHRLR